MKQTQFFSTVFPRARIRNYLWKSIHFCPNFVFADTIRWKKLFARAMRSGSNSPRGDRWASQICSAVLFVRFALCVCCLLDQCWKKDQSIFRTKMFRRIWRRPRLSTITWNTTSWAYFSRFFYKFCSNYPHQKWASNTLNSKFGVMKNWIIFWTQSSKPHTTKVYIIKYYVAFSKASQAQTFNTTTEPMFEFLIFESNFICFQVLNSIFHIH